MRILLLNTTHKSLDDRVYYHQAKSLAREGHQVYITSTCEDLSFDEESIHIRSYNHKHLTHTDKFSQLKTVISSLDVQLIIADSPGSVIAAKHFSKNRSVKVIYDITEWYPSKKYLHTTKGIRKIIKALAQVFYNLYAGVCSDYFIFGEKDKSVPFRILFPFRSYIYLPYFPDKNYIHKYPVKSIDNAITLTYSGSLSDEKGLTSLIESVGLAAQQKKDIQFNIKLIGSFPDEIEYQRYKDRAEKLPDNISVELSDFLPFTEYCNVIGNTHLFFDLRKIDFENSRCLPIKLFYYLACGRPVIYSNLSAIRNEINFSDFGFLVNPEDYTHIAQLIINYIDQPATYRNHAENALHTSAGYSWDLIENEFIQFISDINDKHNTI